MKLTARQGKGSTLFIHLILGGVSSCLWLFDIFVSQVELLRACLHTSVEFLVVTEKSIKFESTIQAVFYAATPNKLHAGVRDSSLHLVAIAFRCVIPMEAKCTFGGRASCRHGGD
jgi:hypothetical protein